MSAKDAYSRGRDISQDGLSQTQQTVILELEAILSTVRQIDSNITKSIELLEQPLPAVSGNSGSQLSQKGLELNYQEMVLRNTELISGILESLKALR